MLKKRSGGKLNRLIFFRVIYVCYLSYTLVIFDDCETELIQHLKEVFGTVPFKFNIINIHKVAGEMFTTAPKNKVDLLNYYLLAFELLYGDYLDMFDRLSEYYSVLQLMLFDYKSTQKKL